MFLHCDPTGPQLSPGSMSPTGYPRSQLNWPESQRDRDDKGGERLFMCVCWSGASVITEMTTQVSSMCDKQALIMCTVCTYRKQESVFKVGELPVTFFAAVQPILLVYDLLVAVCRWTGLVQTILLTSVQQCCHTAEIVRL